MNTVNYTVHNIDTAKGHVTFSLADGIKYTVCDCPLDSKESMDAFMVKFAEGYNPVKEVKIEVAEDVTALVGKKTIVEVPEVVTPVVEIVEPTPVVEAPVEPVVETVEVVPEVVETPAEVPVETVEAPVEVAPSEVATEEVVAPVEAVDVPADVTTEVTG